MMPPAEPVGEKPPDPNGGPPAPSHGGPHGDEGAPAAVTATASTEKIQGAASAAPSYANKLKTNIRFDQRLKRNGKYRLDVIKISDKNKIYIY